MNGCYTCELVFRRNAGDSPLWDNIWQTAHWDVVHSYNSRLLGWLVLISRRHLSSLDEMNSAESSELGPLIQQTSAALKQIVGCEKTYVMQFAEDPLHPHVHFHIVPRMPNQPDEYKATSIFSYLGASEEQRISEVAMNRLASQVREYLNQENLN